MNGFDLDIKNIVNNLRCVMKSKDPDATYCNLQTTFWDDGDYRLELSWSWAEKINYACYRKSSNAYYYFFRDNKECDTIGRVDIDISDYINEEEK